MENMVPIEEKDAIPQGLNGPIGRAAIEGVPVAAIARIFEVDMGETYVVLEYLKSTGTIVEIPKADWPPTARAADHVPQFATKPSASNLMFVAQRTFTLTKLEAGFLTTLLRCEHADKSVLHGIIEQQRMERQQRPNKIMETTDPKMVDVMICKLRKKLRDHDAVLDGAIKTVWGGGYFIDPPAKAAILQVLSDNGAVNVDAEIAKFQAAAASATRH